MQHLSGRLLALLVASLLGFYLVACGSSGGSSSPLPQSPSGGATTAPSPAPSVTVPVAVFPTTVPFSTGAVSGSVGFPALASGSSGSTLTVVASGAAPNGSPVPLSTTRHTLSSVYDLAFIAILPSATLTTVGVPVLQFSMTGLDATKGSFYLALFDPTKVPAAWNLVSGAGAIQNGNLVFAAPQVPMTFAANELYIFELYQVASTNGTVSVTPSSLSFLGIGAGNQQLVSVSEQGYNGAFTLQSTCASIASISASGNTYSVVPLAAGTCSATFTDANGNITTLPIVVTVTTGGGQ